MNEKKVLWRWKQKWNIIKALASSITESDINQQYNIANSTIYDNVSRIFLNEATIVVANSKVMRYLSPSDLDEACSV